LRFFFLLDGVAEDSADGLGEVLAFFFVAGDSLSVGVGPGVVFFFGAGDFSGDGDGFGVGDFSAADFFFVCFRGVGVGVGAKIFFSLLPIDSSAGARTENIAIVPITKNARAILIVRCIDGRIGNR
jgi:hypothetical protein